MVIRLHRVTDFILVDLLILNTMTTLNWFISNITINIIINIIIIIIINININIIIGIFSGLSVALMSAYY